ncbi:MAG TPA: hypothetical protein PLT86_10315 [Candidatus Latescibacteria bacterium]|nr:hypothetical protein [Candidatus Latescibacterota bacterium]HQK22451.1 hypothetical protein [Candidatus Latescibacterota bacterium]
MNQNVAELNRDCEDYSKWWRAVDQELYHYFAEHSDHGNLRSVYAKVAMVDRLYTAGLERARKGTDEIDRAQKVAELLFARGEELDCGIRMISGVPCLTRDALADIAALHGWIAETCLKEAGVGAPVSFVSKYLHFHVPVVPIYDQQACASLARYIRGRFGRYVATPERLPKLDGQMPAYRWYCARFAELWEEAQESRPETTVKELDYHLWVLGKT